MSNISYRLPQEIRLTGEFPGPRYAELAERRAKVVPGGVASSVPVYAADADGGVIVDVDGNSFADLGSGIAVTSVGASAPKVVEAVQD
ncbi:MAG: aminotransferase class III-fold pyridoxal phosphate-dependent enzyme, partial [Kocuria sp.]|nr:aminotransferase class III-fold pyridoxal phosphate-dependent enzyme [Kocuria sp.]